MSIDVCRAKETYHRHFGGQAELASRAPGRVNVIGEHTDYNHGFVLPMAIECETLILARPRADRMLRAFAANLDQEATVSLDDRRRSPDSPWIDYLVGVADELALLGRPLHGADVMVIGDVPIGSGLSSSASLEMATLVLFETLGGFHIDGAEAPRLGQRVENRYLGVSTGIMDQFIVRMGREGHALFLDCRSCEYALVPVAFPNAKFVIADTAVSRGLASSKYNERVAECGEAVAAMAGQTGKGTHLRDFTLDHLEAARQHVSETVYRRARHVITEDVRTQAACKAMRDGDAQTLGQLMDQSDFSLRDDYEVTCQELDTMTEIARGIEGCLGARMTGAGFGGCTVHLVENDYVDRFCTELMSRYHTATGIEGRIIVSAPAAGASLLDL